MDKRTVSTAVAKYAVNPIVSRVAGYVPWYATNIGHDPRVRVRTHGRWRDGIASLLPHDDPLARQRSLGLGANGLFVRLVGTTLLTVRIALDPPHIHSRSR
jgi:hypothetical protein